MRHLPRSGLVAILVVLLVAVTACQAAPAGETDTPTGVARAALDRLASKDVEGLRALTCAGAEESIRARLGLPTGAGGELLPGIDTNEVLDAVTLDTSALTLGDESVTGDNATVDVRGDLGVTFDAAALRPIVKKLLESQGTTLTDQQIDALLATLAKSGQELPVSQTLELRREAGAWKLCSVQD